MCNIGNAVLDIEEVKNVFQSVSDLSAVNEHWPSHLQKFVSWRNKYTAPFTAEQISEICKGDKEQDEIQEIKKQAVNKLISENHMLKLLLQKLRIILKKGKSSFSRIRKFLHSLN